MTLINELLVILMEECAEVAQVSSKAIRFGLDSKNPDNGEENKEAIMREFHDLVAMVELLQEYGALEKWSEERSKFQKEAKKIKVNKLTGISV